MRFLLLLLGLQSQLGLGAGKGAVCRKREESSFQGVEVVPHTMRSTLLRILLWRSHIQSLARKIRQNKARLMDFLIIVPTQLLLFLARPGAQRLTHIASRVFGADHEPDLAGWVGGDCGVGIFSDRKYFTADLLEIDD